MEKKKKKGALMRLPFHWRHWGFSTRSFFPALLCAALCSQSQITG